MRCKAWIPNMLTLANLVFGVCSIFSSMADDFFWSAVCILLALAADGMDGRAARFLGVSSEIGKELDSLCDLVSFGVAPGILAYVFCLHSFPWIGRAVAIGFALCGALRLARFNVSTDIVHGYFMGLAIPAGGCLVATSTLFFQAIGLHPAVFGWFYPCAMTATALLMVSEVHYPDFKGKGEKLCTVSQSLSAALFASILVLGRDAVLPAALFAVFAAYAVLGVVNTVVTRAADGR